MNFDLIEDDNKVNIFDYKFLVPSFIMADDREFDSELLGLLVYYSKISQCYLRVDSVCINWKTWNEYEMNCFYRNCIPLPLIIEDYYHELDGAGYIIKPFKLDDLTEKYCDQLFIKYIFEHEMDYSLFLNTQLYENPNPFVFLSKINSLVLNYHKTDIETLRAKKVILESINTIKEEIGNLFTSLKELQNPSSPTKLEEDLAEPRTLNSILILLDKIGFFQLPQVENLGENKKGELIAFLTKYKESFCKVTIKEMSESSSADGRNNPYNSDKAIKDANNFLTKLNK